ncbi:MAG: hypothetical protein ACU843_17490 [Gammaproteobacteria bacterium]
MTDQPTPEEIKQARLNAGLSAREAAKIVDVTQLTWQRWEGQSSRTTAIPAPHWELFLLRTDQHPKLELKVRR